jgi:hypothetical protein
MSTTTTNLQWHVAAIPPQDNGQQLAGHDLTIDDLIARCQEYDAWKRDYEIKAIDFRLHPNGRFSTGSEEGVYTLEDTALTQLCARYGKPFFGGALPRDYTRALIEQHPAAYAPILHDHACNYGKSIFLRTYGESVRAFMSDRFTHIDNIDVLGILREYLHSPKNGGNYTLVRPYVGRDELNVRVMIRSILPQGGDGPYGVGCVIRTGEIGNISPAVLPFIQRHACTNSTIWEEGGIKLKQTGDRRNKLMLLIAAMGEALQSCGDLIQRMVQAQYEQLPALDRIIDGLAEKFEWSQELTFAVVHGTENQRTVAGLVNGITYAAHAVNLPAQQAVSLEMLGGKLLMAEPVELHRFAK